METRANMTTAQKTHEVEIEQLSSADVLHNPAVKLHRLPQLDLLRGVAILLVLVSHQVYLPASGLMKDIAQEMHVLGQTGVDLFFVLSGFLVGGLLIAEIKKTENLQIGKFLMRRGMKIWPGYYVFIAVAFVHRIWHHESTLKTGAEHMWPLIFNLQNYLGPYDIVTHCWSLAVEEHFYLFLPLLFACVCGRFKRPMSLQKIGVVLGSIIIGCILLRFAIAASVKETDLWLKFSTHARMDALLFGVLLAYLHSEKPRWFSNLCCHPWMLFGIGLLLVNFRTFIHNEANATIWSLDILTTYLGHGLCMLSLLQFEPGRGLVGKALTSKLSQLICFVGIYSYSIYLWHFEFVGPFVMDKIVRHLPEILKFPIGMSVYVIGAVIFGVFAAKLIELPMLKVRERLFPSAI